MVFSKKESAAIKGFAILHIMLQHLISTAPDNIKIYSPMEAKVSVCIFLIISGYGLTLSTRNRSIDIRQFYINRFKKIFATYWTVYVIAVAIGTIYFNRTIFDVYGTHPYIKVFIDFCGLATLFKSDTYNVTWWFMSLIICLYGLFPFWHTLIRRHKACAVGLSFILAFTDNNFVLLYSFPFVLGIYFALNENSSTRCLTVLNNNRVISIIGFSTLVPITVFIRQHLSNYGLIFDNLTALALFCLLFLLFKNIKIISRAAEFFGNFSYEMFLIHTFIFYYFLADFIFSFNNLYVSYLLLISITFAISVTINKLVRFIGF